MIIVGLALFAQLYLFWRLRAVLRSSNRSNRWKFAAVLLTGAAIGGLFAANWHAIHTPIPWVDPPALVQAVLFYAPAVWSFGSIFSALLLLVTRLAGLLFRSAAWCLRRVAGAPEPGIRSPGRRLFLKTSVGGLAAAPFLLSGYGAAYAGRHPVVEELALPFGCALRVVHLTDIHAGIFMTPERIRRYVDQAVALKPDLVALTGDYITNSTAFFPGFAAEISRIRTPLGVYATMGNHEHWHGELEYYRGALNAAGVDLLQNEHRLIRTPSGRFAVAGIDDLGWGRPDLEAALRGIPHGTPVLLLSHRPEIFPRAAGRGVALTLAGHYHGGQVKLSLPGRDFSLAHLRTPYPEGLYRIGGAQLYVSRGIGTTFTPVRLNAPPEVTFFRLA